MRCACIDIGSNTTRLLVAELAGEGLREVAVQRVFHRLRGELSAEMIDAVCATIASFLETARAAGAASVTIVGTAAIRASPTGAALCDAVLARCGVPVTVLSPTDEARLAFLGATATVDAPDDGLVAVVDVGGGSSEVVCGTAGGDVSWSASLPIGSGTLADEHLSGDPPDARELGELRAAAAAALAGLDPPEVVAAYAVGGSATSLRRLLGPSLDRDALARAVDAMCSECAEDVARSHDLHRERVRVLPAGMVLLEAASAVLGLPLQIAGGGLREGVVLQTLRR